MQMAHLFKSLAPVFVLAMGAGLSACDGSAIKINGEEGKKLSELDLSGKAPDELMMFGPDRIEVTAGDKLTITVDGDPAVVEQLRFFLKDGTLGVTRADKAYGGSDKVAVIRITMPAPHDVGMFGSGTIQAAMLGRDAKVVIAGSGQIEAGGIEGGKLDVTMPGSGGIRAVGNVDMLDLTILGSGNAQLDALRAQKAKITIAGSGGATFASDGDVEATIMGSGTVTVKGRARCTVSAMGSGKLVCENGVTESDPGQAPSTPESPKAP